jgi:hypothetical protein
MERMTNYRAQNANNAPSCHCEEFCPFVIARSVATKQSRGANGRLPRRALIALSAQLATIGGIREGFDI